MFSSGRLSKLIERFTGGSSDAPAAAAASAAASPAASPAPPAAHPDSGAQQQPVQAQGSARGGGRGGRGGGRGGRGGGGGGGGGNGQGNQRPQSARSPPTAAAAGDSEGSAHPDSGSATQRERGGGRGGRGRGGSRGGRGGGNNNNNAPGVVGEDGGEAGQPRQQRQPRNRNNARPASAQPTAVPLDAAAASFVPGASSPSNSSASNPSSSPQPDAAGGQQQQQRQQQQQAQQRGPSKKQLAVQQAAAAAAAERARQDAELDSPTNPLNIPSPALATELRLLSMRYNKSLKQEQFRSSISITLSFAPSDPDFPFELPPEQLQLNFIFHDVSLFPYAALPPKSGTNDAQLARLQARVQVRCTNDERHVPSYMRAAIESSLHFFICHSQFGVPALMRNTLKMLDREVSDWMQLAQRKQNAKVEQTLAKLMGPAAAAAAMAAAAAAAVAPATDSASDEASPAPSAASIPSSSPSPALAASASATAASSSSSAAPAPAAAAAEEPEDEWTPAQQTQLESALKSVPRTLPSAERWDAIAAAVEGKTKKQVLARYKKIRDAVKGGGAGGDLTKNNAAASSTAAAASHAPTAAASSSSSSSSSAAAAPQLAIMSMHRSNARDVDPDETAAIHAARIRDQQIERRMEALRIEEARLEEEERALALGKKPKKKKQAPQPEERKHASDSGNSSGSDSDDGDDDEASSDESSDRFEAVTERMSLNPQHRGTQLVMLELEMSGLGILKSSLVRVELLCVRCESRVEMEFGPGNGASNPVVQRCSRCGIHHTLRYRAEMVHEHSDSLGYVDLENCEVYDVRELDLFGTCIADECFTEAPMKALQRGRTFDTNCRHCHTRLTCKFDQIEIVRITPAALVMEEPNEDSRGRKAAGRIDPAEVAAAKNRVKEQALLKVGTALPNKGACKHYKRSFRWMRFPCCGKAYPCDICHEEAEGHGGEWATRMICGNCSKEQPFSSKPCVHCGLAFSTVAKTFWEGGSGMRDRKRLNRNDSKKHAGLTKTKSAKENRVGKKAKDGAPYKSSKEHSGNTA